MEYEGTYDLPEDVVKTSDNATVSWVRNLNDVGRTNRGDHVDSETHEETSTHELLSAPGGGNSSLDDNTDNNDTTGDHHTNFSSPGIKSRANEWDRGDGTDLGHGADNTGTDTDVGDAEECLEAIVTEQVTEHARVETVGGGAEEANHADQVELDGNGVEWNWRLLDHGLGVVVVSMDKLGLDDVALVEGRVFLFVDIGAQLLLAEVGHCIEILLQVCGELLR